MHTEPLETPPQEKSMTLASPVDVCRAAAGLALQEAVNLGEINPAMARRFGERMDQIFNAFMRGAGVAWTKDGTVKFTYPEPVNPILAAVQERKAKRGLDESTVLTQEQQFQNKVYE